VIEKYIKYFLNTKSNLIKEQQMKELKNSFHSKSIYNLYFFDLFECIQEGKGFYDLLKPFMTKKEIYFFIFKSNSVRIEDAALEGKLLNLQAEQKVIDWATNRTYQIQEKEVFLFIEYLIKKNVSFSEIQEFYDYFYAIKRNRIEVRIDDKYILITDFLKRDVNTIRQASNEWHIMQTKLKKSEIAIWEKKFETFEEEKGQNIFSFVELNTTRQLLNEGRTMKHCVGSYASRCINGETRIVSIKKDGLSYLTLELNRNAIIQAKLKANNIPDRNDHELINKFADKYDLKVSV
jgi:hypothetical protein